MKKLIAIISISLLVLAGCGSSGNFEAQTNWEVQDFNYVNQHNKKVSLEGLKGTVWLATFVFTNCTSVCPPMTFNMSEIQQMLVDKGVKDYKIVAFSVDPEVDTPQKLQEYLGNYDVADESKWQLLTGYKQDEIANFAEKSFKTLVKDDPKSNQVIHGTSFYLVDQNGVVVKNYSGVSDVPKEEIVMDVENLVEDGK
ncbi:SCO family protein [Psychrobacillus glaciei]|uniref:SCO family protein n=1 Tax=Psychrobacillus glaciei TaxID=2283160 RepID=A0A5J6SM70_9BACI|nr:SCO family protein [Psychrobacillus glaciei]QFF99100.1 SCO family protein [Psychrobacillus glaciei]